MTILNLMLGRKRGGLEQAVLDYAEALAAAQLPALTLISPKAWVEAPLASAHVDYQTLNNAARFDPLAAYRLRRVAARTGARVILCHGNRALALALMAFKDRTPRPAIVAVAHNYSVRRFIRADACFAITEHLAAHLRQSGATAITVMPNMVRLPPTPLRPTRRTPPIIGSMGRFVGKKGFEHLVHALAIVRDRGVAFEAIIGGDGERAQALRMLIDGYGMQSQVHLNGWVKDKASFFGDLDLFVLPSLHEPFGIVLIEAMAYGVPVVTTDAEGPREIVRPNIDALMCCLGDAEALAGAIITALGNAAQANAMADAARHHVAITYSMPAMAGRLQTALSAYTTPHA